MNSTPTALSGPPVTFSDGSTLHTLSGAQAGHLAHGDVVDAGRVRDALVSAVARPGVAAGAVLLCAQGLAACRALDDLLAAYRAACRPPAP
jgi:hypothetical protein